MEPRESVELIANLKYYRKISGVVARGKVLAIPLLALFLVPFLIEAAQAFQLNRVDYRPAVTQPINRAPLGGINGSNFSTNRFNYASSGINRPKTFSTNRSNYAPTFTRSVNPGVTQMNTKMYGTGNKSMNINPLMGNQTFKQNIGVPRNNDTNLNHNLTRTTGVDADNSSQRNVSYNGARGRKFQD